MCLNTQLLSGAYDGYDDDSKESILDSEEGNSCHKGKARCEDDNSRC